MKLQRKTLILFAILFLLLCAAVFGTLHGVVLERFTKIESDTMALHLKRIRHSINTEIARLEDFAVDWGEWNETYRYLDDGNSDYREANLYGDAFRSINMDGFFLLDRQGRVIWSILMDPQSHQPSMDRSISQRLWDQSSPLKIDAFQPQSGIFLADKGPLIYASHPVVRSDGSGPARGHLVFVRYLGPELVASLRQQTELPVKIQSISSARAQTLPEVEFVAANQLRGMTFLAFSNTDTQVLSALLDLPRPIHHQALSTIELATLLLILSGLLLSGFFFYLFHRQLVRPVVVLTQTMSQFGESDFKLPACLVRNRRDEVGELARTFQRMARNIVHQQQRLIEERDQAANDSRTDPLTGLYNRRHLDEFLSGADIPEEAPVWLFLSVDIDHFKQVNDRYGHGVGDEVLKQFAALLSGCIRTQDMAVRIGGEEFALVCRESTLDQGPEIAERIRTRVAAHSFECRGHQLRLTCSIGYLGCRFLSSGRLYPHLNGILELSDMALYAAKHSGRNSWIGLECNVTGDAYAFPRSLSGLQQAIEEAQIQVTASTSTVIWN